MECQPFEIAAIAAHQDRSAWDAAAVEILGAVLTRWGLTVNGEQFTGGQGGTVVRVVTSDGDHAVLKVAYPHEEAVYEAVGLAALPDGTAPVVLRQDPWLWALLITELTPGSKLSASSLSATDALRCGGALLSTIAATGAVNGLPTLAEVVHGYATVARSRWEEQRSRLDQLDIIGLIAEATNELDELADGAPTTGFVHGDYNPGNILSSGDGWAVIDPKPMIGDSCYDLWPLVSQVGSPFAAADPSAVLADRMAVAADAAGLDPVRCTRWAFARSGLTVSWYLADDQYRYAAREAAELRQWAIVRERLLS